LQRSEFGPAAARLSSHFKQRTKPEANPATLIDPITKMSIYQEQLSYSINGKFTAKDCGDTARSAPRFVPKVFRRPSAELQAGLELSIVSP
jgi:hypothetical protein